LSAWSAAGLVHPMYSMFARGVPVMTATLWIDTDNEETLELGGTLPLYSAFAEMEKAAGPGCLEDYPALFAVVPYVESQDDAPPDYLADLAAEARAFREKYGARVSDHAHWLLGAFESLAQRN
jgi:hypothetical protein